uniref:WRKY transcription factor 59 n=1 Tax=Santalum album TaxID=35974 RepID=A0A650C2Z2_SANAL|nr:WRKY transcription factor 59 [Santalum album]
MAVDLLGSSEMDEQIAIQEAASAGIKSMEHLVRLLSHHHRTDHRHPDCAPLAGAAVSEFRNLISLLNRTGHARFRRGPPATHPPVPISQTLTLAPPPSDLLAAAKATSKTLNLDFTKPNALSAIPKAIGAEEGFSISPPMSSTNSSFMSSITGDGSVSNGRQGSSLFSAPANSAGKPPLSMPSFKKRCREHDRSGEGSGNYSGSGRCHCSSKRRKTRFKRTIRVPAISSRIADIPPDEYSWRKYGQKPIKGSPYPRGYYKCSSVRGCSARKHVERAPDDSTMLVVTYEGEHRHSVAVMQENIAAGASHVFESSA